MGDREDSEGLAEMVEVRLGGSVSGKGDGRKDGGGGSDDDCTPQLRSTRDRLEENGDRGYVPMLPFL